MGADSKLKRYKVIQEYEHIYLTINENGHRECFIKALYVPDENGYIMDKIDLRHEKEFYSKTEEIE